MADPGFAVGGCQLPTQALFGENVCENERIRSHWGGAGRRQCPLDPPMNMYSCIQMKIEYSPSLVCTDDW